MYSRKKKEMCYNSNNSSLFVPCQRINTHLGSPEIVNEQVIAELHLSVSLNLRTVHSYP